MCWTSHQPPERSSLRENLTSTSLSIWQAPLARSKYNRLDHKFRNVVFASDLAQQFVEAALRIRKEVDDEADIIPRATLGNGLEGTIR